MRVWRDEKGIYIRDRYACIGGRDHYRPGPVPGYSHAYNMSDGGLGEGDNPRTRHIPEAGLVRIYLSEGRELVWAQESLHPTAPGDE